MNYFEIVKEIIKILWEEEWPEYQADGIFDLLLKENLIPSFNRNEIKEAWEKMDVPTIEAVPIVRCKDCRYNYANMIPGGKGCQQNVYIETADNWYCADGEREDEVEE